jgi:hypothetical protein
VVTILGVIDAITLIWLMISVNEGVVSGDLSVVVLLLFLINFLIGAAILDLLSPIFEHTFF